MEYLATTVTVSFKQNQTTSQININLHTRGLLITLEVPTTQNILFSNKKLQDTPKCKRKDNCRRKKKRETYN